MKRRAVLFGSGVVAMLFASLAVAKQPAVEVCHEGEKTIRIAAAAVPAHVRHGDTACACEAIEDCAAQGGDLDAQTCECLSASLVCEPAGICDDAGYTFGCEDNPDCACGTDSAGNGVCMFPADCFEVEACPNGQSDCPDGTVCVVATCCEDFGIPDICAPLCPPAP